MSTGSIAFYKSTPFLRFLLPLCTGILCQWQFGIKILVWWLLLGTASIILFSFFYIPFVSRFRKRAIAGTAGSLVFISVGAILLWHQDIRNDQHWIGKLPRPPDQLVVTLVGNLVEKPNSFKALGIVSCKIEDHIRHPAKGKVIVYFKKEDRNIRFQEIGMGTRIFIIKQAREIANNQDRSAFDYKRFCLFRGITHQVFLRSGEFLILARQPNRRLDNFLETIRMRVLRIFSKNIPGEKERGLAEALLIGHKADLDPGLVQSYTNTGVVHIIAISGMHLGLIYGILLKLLHPFSAKKAIRWLRPAGIVAGLWIFTLLAGAEPSVTRSALMFTFIVLGRCLARKAPIINILAVSAFLLLCYNPFWFWDPGFQLSYSAVLSIVIFQKPIYHWVFFQNKFVDFLWQLNSVTLAAQILTTPISIYHFHQFPNYFIFTNLLAVPLSGIIIMVEILLCVLSLIAFLPELCGKFLTILIRLMNNWIETIERIPFSVSHGLYINPFQLFLSFLFILGISLWLMDKSKTGLKTALASLCLFCLADTF